MTDPTAWRPTPELRMVETGIGDRVLQQAYQRPGTDHFEWRPVPTIRARHVDMVARRPWRLFRHRSTGAVIEARWEYGSDHDADDRNDGGAWDVRGESYLDVPTMQADYQELSGAAAVGAQPLSGLMADLQAVHDETGQRGAERLLRMQVGLTVVREQIIDLIHPDDPRLQGLLALVDDLAR